MQNNTKISPITQKEYEMFLCQLNSLFEFHIINKKKVKKDFIKKVEKLGVKIQPIKEMYNVATYDNETIPENAFFFRSNPKQEAFYYFWNHLRNCASHRGGIQHYEREGCKYYYFKDVKVWGGNKTTMVGIIRVGMWEDFIKSFIRLSGIK